MNMYVCVYKSAHISLGVYVCVCVCMHTHISLLIAREIRKTILMVEQKTSSELGKIKILWLKHKAAAS